MSCSRFLVHLALLLVFSNSLRVNSCPKLALREVNHKASMPGSFIESLNSTSASISPLLCDKNFHSLYMEHFSILITPFLPAFFPIMLFQFISKLGFLVSSIHVWRV